ncbi:MAG: UDP-3-O-acyl-N-acetylglucosamine deacetylase, partial [Muribaculaceae bacterium]|nr:UDP-3-O-acyl-N-acetylglucosamine deacetylase [Muribaculaceae bacterium]
MNQLTLKDSFTVEGKTLHSGVEMKATFKPAEANTGIRFKRIDLEGEPEIPALAEKVVDTTRGTVIAQGEARVSTIEHAMAALYAAGIDNCVVEVNGPEMPILDGSALHYIENIERVGVEELNEEKDYYIIKSKTKFRDEETGSSITIYPDDGFSVEVMVEYNSPVLPNQFAILDNLADFHKKVASARTFVFVREIEALLQNGLIKG